MKVNTSVIFAIILELLFCYNNAYSQTFSPLDFKTINTTFNAVKMTVTNEVNKKETKIFDGYKESNFKLSTIDNISSTTASFDLGGYFKNENTPFYSFNCKKEETSSSIAYTYSFSDNRQLVAVFIYCSDYDDEIKSITIYVINDLGLKTKNTLTFQLSGFTLKENY